MEGGEAKGVSDVELRRLSEPQGFCYLLVKGASTAREKKGYSCAREAEVFSRRAELAQAGQVSQKNP